MSSNTSDLPHGVYYVTRDGSTVYRVDADDLSRLAIHEQEAVVARALLDLGGSRIARAVHVARTSTPTV